MAVRSDRSATSAETELVVTRIFDAPRELVFQAWTQNDHLKHWQAAPRGFTVTPHESDIRPGGRFRISMHSPDGAMHRIQGVYREVTSPERLVFTHMWLDEAGNPGPETLVTITFAAIGSKTELTLRQTGFTSAGSRDGHQQGWSSALERLVEYLDSVRTADREMVFTRVFNAPRELVFDAWTSPEHVANWWGPKGFTTTIHQMDVRPGGEWRFVMHGPDGVDYNNRVVFIELRRPELLVYKHVPEKDTEPVSFETTVTFADREGKTELRMRMLFASAAERDFVVRKYGAEEGATQTLGRLMEYVESLR